MLWLCDFFTFSKRNKAKKVRVLGNRHGGHLRGGQECRGAHRPRLFGWALFRFFFGRELLGISFNEGWKCPFSKKIIETLLDLTSGSLETARVPLSKNNIALGLKIISSNNSQSLKQNQRVRNNLPPPPSWTDSFFSTRGKNFAKRMINRRRRSCSFANCTFLSWSERTKSLLFSSSRNPC